VRAGMLRSMHTMDIPFVMENVDIAKTELGEGKERYALQDRMSTAFVTFARTGNPNHKGIPNWSPYTPAQRATMIWNNECRVVNDPYREEKDAIAAVEGRNRTAS
jgi:para-nitrobenzyl esterase